MFKKFTAAAVALSLLGLTAFADTFQLRSGSMDAQILTDAVSAITLENAPVCKDGRTLIEIGDAEKLFGITSSVTDDTITISLNDKSIKLYVGKNILEGSETKELDTVSDYIDGKLFIPLRAVLENLGFGVSWSAALNKVVVSNSPVVMEIDGNSITLDEFNLYYDIQIKSLEASGVSPEEISEYESVIREQVIASLSELNTLYYAAIGSGFSSTLEAGTAKAEIASYTEDFIKNSGIIVLDSTVALELEKSTIVNNYVQAVGMSVSVTDEEIENLYKSEYITAKHILIPSVNLETGEPLSEKEVADSKKLAEDIAAKIKDGEDFDKLMNEYSEDTGLESYPNGYTFTKGEMVAEFEAAALALEENAVSDIIETFYGYHIIKRLPLEELTDDLKANLKSVIGNSKVSEYISNILNQSDVKIYSE